MLGWIRLGYVILLSQLCLNTVLIFPDYLTLSYSVLPIMRDTGLLVLQPLVPLHDGYTDVYDVCTRYIVYIRVIHDLS